MSKPKNEGRICLECEHCWVWGGHPGYSEYTPSSPFDFSCHKGHPFETNPAQHEGSKASLIRDIRKAETCPDFELEEKA